MTKETAETKSQGAHQNRPMIGQTIRVYGQLCRIVKIRAFGTVDCVSFNGNNTFRISGLNFI